MIVWRTLPVEFTFQPQCCQAPTGNLEIYPLRVRGLSSTAVSTLPCGDVAVTVNEHRCSRGLSSSLSMLAVTWEEGPGHSRQGGLQSSWADALAAAWLARAETEGSVPASHLDSRDRGTWAAPLLQQQEAGVGSQGQGSDQGSVQSGLPSLASFLPSQALDFGLSEFTCVYSFHLSKLFTFLCGLYFLIKHISRVNITTFIYLYQTLSCYFFSIYITHSLCSF